jgi:hypothetical protein
MIVMQMVVAFDVVASGQYEDVPVGVHHVDIRAVELRQHWRRHDFCHRP